MSFPLRANLLLSSCFGGSLYSNLLCLVPLAGKKYYGPEGQLVLKVIGLQSMHSFICRIVPYITFYFLLLYYSRSHSIVIFSVFCDVIPLAGRTYKILLAIGTARVKGNWPKSIHSFI